MGNKCCKSQSSTYSSANATIRSFSSYNSSIVRSGGSHALTFGGTSTRGDSLTTLTMKSSDHSDVGKDYRGGSSSTVGQDDPIPVFLRRLNDLNTRVGTRTRFLIELDDASGVQVRWFHNNLEAGSDRYQYIHEGGFYCLDIVPVTLEDEGLWVCTAQNYAGKSSTAAHLSLIVPKAFKKPIFIEPLRAVLTQRGIVSLECKVIGVPTPKLRWYKDDREIKAGDIFALTANSDDCLGIYTCEATNVMGTTVSTSKIQVTHTEPDGKSHADSLIPYGPSPRFVKGLKNATGKVGNVLTLECQVEIPPWPRSVGWYNDAGVVNEGALYHLIADGMGMYGVEIKSLRADHGTTWKCVATSLTGAKAVSSCLVTVSCPKNYRVPRFLESLRAIMTDEGLVSFECKVIGYPTPQLSWFKDGKQLQPGDVYELTGSKSLGSYCCVARNCMGETSSIAELTIEDIQNQLNESEKLQLTSNTQPPRFLLGLKSAEATINESFVFMIKVTTESTPSISWYKEDEELTESNRYQFSTEDDGIFVLNIVPLEIDDQAEWKCVAVNKYGQTVTSSFLKLNIPKNFKSPRFLEELRIAFSNEGSVNLECKVIGVPQPQLKWFKDGQELNPGDMHKIISGQSGACCLGTYTCQAHNCMGTVSSSATLLTMEDKSTVKSCASEEYLSVGNPLVRNESLSTIPEERTSQMEKSYTIEEPADISFSFDGKEVTVSLYETPDLTHDEALQIIEMYADELSEHISEDNVVDLPSLRIVKESSISGPVMMEALVIDVPIGFCQQQTVSDTEFDGVSLTEDTTLANVDKNDSLCENSLEYFSDHLSSSNSKRDVFFSASETTPKNASLITRQRSQEEGHPSFQTPKLFMSDSDDQILTQLKLEEKGAPQTSRKVVGPLARSESNNTEEEVSETLADVENELPLPQNYCAAEALAQSHEKDVFYSAVLNRVQTKDVSVAALGSEEDDGSRIVSRPNVDEFLNYMKILLEGTTVKMHAHQSFNYTDLPTELERSIQALHSLAWKFIEETEKDDVTELDKSTTENVSSLMTAVNASLLALEQIDDPFGVSDNVLNEIQSSVCLDLETLNNRDLSATDILNLLSDQIQNFTTVVNRQVARVTEQRVMAVLRNTIGTTLVYIKTLQQNFSKIKCININSLTPIFSMVQPLETILNDIALIEEASAEDGKCNLKFKQMLIPPISSIAFSLDNLNTALKNENPEDDQELRDIYSKINDATNQFMILASQGTEAHNLAECFISFTKPINDLCCHLRRLGRSTENIISSDYGSDDKLLMDFETLFDELMMDIDTLINNVNVVRDSENNMNPLGSLLEPLQDMKIGLFQVNQVLLSNQTSSNMSYEVMSCFEHLSHQLVQLNNCIINQSIVEETDKELPFESSIKLMQNILFDDSIDDLGVNGILFGSVMKPLLQLQNLIVSKMASVESDLSFSEHTDATGGAQSLSLSLSNNAQTVFDKADEDNLKPEIVELPGKDNTANDCDVDNQLLQASISKAVKDSALFENNGKNDLLPKRDFKCEIEEAFRDEEPSIIMPEDDRENSGFEVLFNETDLETVSDFIDNERSYSAVQSEIEPSEALMNKSDIDSTTEETDYNIVIPQHVLASFDNNIEPNSMLNSSDDFFDELQETLKNIAEGTLDETKEASLLDEKNQNSDDNCSHRSDKCISRTDDLIDESLDEDKQISHVLIKQILGEAPESNTENRQHDEIAVKSEQDDVCVNQIDHQVSEITQETDSTEEVEFVDSDKTISNNTIITNNDTSDSLEMKTVKINDVTDVKTTVDAFTSSTVQNKENTSEIEDLSDEVQDEINITSNDQPEIDKANKITETASENSDFNNETSAPALLKNLDAIESIEGKDSSETIHSRDKKSSEKQINEPFDFLDTSKISENSSDHSNENIADTSIGIEDDGSLVQVETDELADTALHVDTSLIKNSEDLHILEKHQQNLDQVKIEENMATVIKTDTENEIVAEIPANACDCDCVSPLDSDLKIVSENKTVNQITDEHNILKENVILEENQFDTPADEAEVIEEVNVDKISNSGFQETKNSSSTTDGEQISVSDSSKLLCANTVSPITELNVIENKNPVPCSSNEIKSDSASIIDEQFKNVEQALFIEGNSDVQNIGDTVAYNTEELNEKCKNLSNLVETRKSDGTNEEMVLTADADILIDSKRVDKESTRISNDSNNIESDLTIKQNVDKNVDLKSLEVEALIPVVDLEVPSEPMEKKNELPKDISKMSVIDKPVGTESNENEINSQIPNESYMSDKDIGIKEVIGVTSKYDTLNEIASDFSNEIKVEKSIPESTVESNNDLEYINISVKSIRGLEQISVLNDENATNDTVCELIPSASIEPQKEPLLSIVESSALISSEVVAAESTRILDLHKPDGNEVEVKHEENRKNAMLEPQIVLECKDGSNGNSEHLETKYENEEEQPLIRNNNLKKESIEVNTDSSNVSIEQNAVMVCDEANSIDNARLIEDVNDDNLKIVDEKSEKILENLIGTGNKSEEQTVKNKPYNESSTLTLSDEFTRNDGDKEDCRNVTNEQSEIQTPKSDDEKTDLAENRKEENTIGTENVGEELMKKSELYDESSVESSITEIEFDKRVTDLETTNTNTEKGKCIDKTHSCDSKYLPFEEGEIKNLDSNEHNSNEQKVSISIQENIALDNIEVVAVDYEQAMTEPNVCCSNLEENNVKQYLQVTEGQTVNVIESADNFKTNLPDECTELNPTEEIVSPVVEIEFNGDANGPIKEQSRVSMEECSAILNEETLGIDETKSLKPCDITAENVSETIEENLVGSVKTIELNVVETSIDSNENAEEIDEKESNTDEIKKELIEPKDLRTSDISLETSINNKPSDVTINQEETNNIKSTNTETNVLESTKIECTSDITHTDGKLTESSSKESLCVSEEANDAAARSISIMPSQDISNQNHNESNELECTANLIKIKADDESTSALVNDQENEESDVSNINKGDERSVTDEPESMVLEENESKTSNEMKVNERINVSDLEKKADVLCETVTEDVTTDLTVEDNLSDLTLKPKLHCVEQKAANQTECVTLESANILKQDGNGGGENIIEHARVEHELNIAAIGNMVMDYDSVKENTTKSSSDQCNTLETANIATIDEHSNEIVLKNIDVLNAPNEHLMLNIEDLRAEKVPTGLMDSSAVIGKEDNNDVSTTDCVKEQIENDDESKIENKQIRNEVIQNFPDKIEGSHKNSDENIPKELHDKDTKKTESASNLTKDIKITNGKTTEDTDDRHNIRESLNECPKKSSSDIFENINELNKENLNSFDVEEGSRKLLDNKDCVENTEFNIQSENNEDNNKNISTHNEIITKVLGGIEKVESNENQIDNKRSDKVDANQVETMKDKVDNDKTKRGSKKKKTSPQPQDEKLQTPEKSFENSESENKIHEETKSIDLTTKKSSDIVLEDQEKMIKLEPDSSGESNTIISKTSNNENDENMVKETDKTIAEVDSVENQKHSKIDSDKTQSLKDMEDTDKKKRGSKKKKTSPQPQDKKLQTPEKSFENSESEKKIHEKTKSMDLTTEKSSEIVLEDQEKMIKLETKLEPDSSGESNTIISKISNNKNDENMVKETDKTIAEVDSVENQKHRKIDSDKTQSLKDVENTDKKKRGSKKKKTSPQPQDKKLQTPEKSFENSESEKKIHEKTKSIDLTTEKSSEIVLEDQEKMIKQETKLRPDFSEERNTIISTASNNENDENMVKETDKTIAKVDSVENREHSKIDSDKKQSLKDEEDTDKKKRGSKKKKTSPQLLDKKLPSLDTSLEKGKIQVDEKTIVIESTAEEKSKNPIENAGKIEKRESKLEQVITKENNEKTSEVLQNENGENAFKETDKTFSNDEKKESNKLEADTTQTINNEVDKDKKKRGSKKKKTSLQPNDKKSPSPDKSLEKSESGIKINENTKIIGSTKEEKTKESYEIQDDTQNLESKSESVNAVEDATNVAKTLQNENNENAFNETNKIISRNDQTKNNEPDTNQIEQMKDEVDIDKQKRGSKKKKTSPGPQDANLPLPDKSLESSEIKNKIGDKTKTIDLTDITKLESKSKLGSSEESKTFILKESKNENKENVAKETDKVVANDNQTENQKDNALDADKTQSVKDEVDIDKRKRGSKKKKTSPQPQDEQSLSLEKSLGNSESEKINDEKLKIVAEVQSKKLTEDTKKPEPKLEQVIALENNENTSEKLPNKINETDKTISKDDQAENNKLEVDKNKPVKNEINTDKKKQGSKKKKRSQSPQNEKSVSPDELIAMADGDHIKIKQVIEVKSILASDMTKDDTNSSDTLLEKSENERRETNKNELKTIPNEIVIDHLQPAMRKGKEKIPENGITEVLETRDKNELKTSDVDKNVVGSKKSKGEQAKDFGEVKRKTDYEEAVQPELASPGDSRVKDTAAEIRATERKSDEPYGKDLAIRVGRVKSSDDAGKRTVTKTGLLDAPRRDFESRSLTPCRRIENGVPDVLRTSSSAGPEERPARGKDASPSRCYLAVTDAHRSRLTPLTYRSLTPELSSSSYRSLTPGPTRFSESTRPYARPAPAGGDADLYRSARPCSPYPEPTRPAAGAYYSRNLSAAATAVYRSPSETVLRTCRRQDDEDRSSRYTRRRRHGSDSFLHGPDSSWDHYSNWRLTDTRDDLDRTKETFKRLYFCVRLIDQTVSSGARVKFWCSVIGYPEPRVQWYRDGQKLNSFTYNSSARYQTKYTNGLAQLIVDNAQSGDSGEYTCVAVNSGDRISTTGYLTVYTSPTVFGAAPKRPLRAASLSVDGLKSTSLDRHYLWSGDDSRQSFRIGGGWRSSDDVSRYPRYPKFVTTIIADDVATYGGTIALQVQVQGSPSPNVTWMRESKPLPRLSVKYVYLDEGGLHTLLVRDSTARDGGTYVCRACNLYGTANVEKAVRVVSPQDYSEHRGVKPAIIVSRPNDRMNVAVGEDITVTLRVAGEPKPKVVWMRGSRDVTFLDRSLKETVNDYVKLSIKRAQLSDAGTYFIIAKNVYGSDRAFVTVGVRKRARSLTPPRIRNTIGPWRRTATGCGARRNDVPGPVSSEPVVSDRANNRISLRWDKPDKAETVLVYRVDAQTADDQCWSQVGMTPTNSIDVYNLKPGNRYQFRVTARNRFGWGQPVVTSDYVDVWELKHLPEFFQPLPGETKVLLRHSAKLQCHVRGVPVPQVTWFKDGEPLVTAKYATECTERGRCTLTIADAADEDAGRYACEAVNGCGRVTTLTVVEVMANRRIVEAEQRLQGCLMKNNDFKESAPAFTKRLIDRRVEINSTVRLSCQVHGLPVPSVSWYKDSRPVDFAAGDENSCRDSDDFSTLELTKVKYDDSGVYTAVASNTIGTATTRCVLEVINKNRTDPAVPEFIFGLPPTHEAADSIILKAQIDAYRPVKVEWFRDGIQLRNGRRVDIITDHDGNLELRIACVTRRDSGTYMLRVSNDTGTIESRCDVDVVERKHLDAGLEQISMANNLYSEKPKFVVKPKFQEVEEGQQVIIDSEIVGDPKPKITWLRDGLKPEYYRDNSEFTCVTNGNRHQLKIPHAKLTHTGTYTLLAANPHGQIKALISLQVYSTGHCKKKMENGSNRTTVERLPRISRGLLDVECSENDCVAFECKLNITQETDVRWQKDGKLVRLGKEIKSELVGGDTARLEISTVGPLHEGLYTCTAFNELGQDSTSARLILSDSARDVTAKSTTPSNGQRKTMLGSPKLAGESNDRSSKRLKRSSAPKFYAVLHDKIADVGETVRFQCSVSGHPPPWSSWEKDGRPIGINSRMRIREDDDHRSLEICDITADDAGLYRITVENKFGKIQATARLEVMTHHQTNDIQITSSTNGRRQSGSTACAGENFTLSCDIRGNSMSDVTWYKNDEEVKPSDRVTSNRDDLAARLSISNLQLADTGVYTCIARCESGVTRCSAELCVFDTKLAKDSYLQPPIFVEGLVPMRTAGEGERLELTVKLQGAVPMSATWFKDDVPVPDCEDFEYAAGDNGIFSLFIVDPFSADSGNYSCKVVNTFGEAVSHGQLVIKEIESDPSAQPAALQNTEVMPVELNNNSTKTGGKDIVIPRDEEPTATAVTTARLPATILWGPCDTTVLRGARVVLETSYAGNPEPRIQWLRAGKVLVETDERLRITNADGISSLTIDSITADDCGKYIVRVDNGLGNDYHFASVAVEGPPDPPAGRPAVSVSETSADVTWPSPAYDGGCMVTGYSVEVRPFNQSDWKLVADRCHSLSHIVRGLAPGESYVFRVRAENMHGSSEASLESIPVYILQTDYGNTLVPKKVSIENGELFTKQYEVLDELGKGRYGVVRKVKERETSKYYAAKFVRCIKSKDKEKAQEEVDIMNCLRHPKLLQLDAAYENPREVVMVTEYISGGELFERVVADDFTLTEKDCILFTRQICEGVDYMHKQSVVHLDLKPENIMCQSRTSHQVKLIDFGLAQKILPGKPIRVLFGTPEFIPPEIISYEPIGVESDMWSVGVICYVLLSGLSPFMGDNDAETFTNITKAEFDFDDDSFDAISQDSKDFISALLIKRKEKRLTARECLKHKWLAQQDMDMSCVILSTDKLKKFIIRRKWQKTGNAIRALGRMATMSAASRRCGGSGGAGGGGGVCQQFKMASLSEEESVGESSSSSSSSSPTPLSSSSPSRRTSAAAAAVAVADVRRPKTAAAEVAESVAMAVAASRGGRRSCDVRSDSGFSECSSLASSTSSSSSLSSPATAAAVAAGHHHVRLSAAEKPSAIAEETCHQPPPATARLTTAATRPAASRSPAHALLPTLGTGAGGSIGGVCQKNRLIFDGARREGCAGSGATGGGAGAGGIGGAGRVAAVATSTAAAAAAGAGVHRKEPIRIQRGDNFKKAVAFWKQ